MVLRFIRLISSWRLTAALTLGFVSAYLYFTFGDDPFEDWLNFVFKSPPGIFIYVSLILNLTAASGRLAFRKLHAESINPDVIKSMDAYVDIPLWSTDPLSTIAEIAGKNGFGMEIIGSTAVSHKGRYSFIPGTVFRAGLVLLMIAALFSVNIRKSDKSVFYEGGGKELLGRVFNVEKIAPGLPENFLQVGDKSSFELEGVSAVVSVAGRKHTVTNGMSEKVRDTYLRITHLGYTQPISGRTPTTVFDWDVFLDVLPPGKTDSETLLSNIHSLAFTLAPVKTIEKGLVTGKLYNVREPTYSLAIVNATTGERSETVEASPSETVRVGDVDITLGKNSVYVEITAVQDAALSWIYLGTVFLLAGGALMLSRFFWYEKKLYAFRTYEAVLVGYSEEFYKKWGILKFERVREELLSHTRSRE